MHRFMESVMARSLTAGFLLIGALMGCDARGVGVDVKIDTAVVREAKTMDTDKVVKTDEQWRAELTGQQYRVLREKGTERAFTGAYWETKTAGVYVCAGCGEELYSSETKFKSGTGWPSFWEAVSEGAVATEVDKSFGTVRTEVLCGRCGGHLGHVFDDGPLPTGKRHCINSASLKLVQKE